MSSDPLRPEKQLADNLHPPAALAVTEVNGFEYWVLVGSRIWRQECPDPDFLSNRDLEWYLAGSDWRLLS